MNNTIYLNLNMLLVMGSIGRHRLGVVLHCLLLFFWWISWFGVQLVALTADDRDCVGVCKWMCPWLYWNGLRRLTAFPVPCLWAGSEPCPSSCGMLLPSDCWILSMIVSKTYFLSLPSSYILLQLLFVMSQALLSGAYRAIISMRC